MTEAESIELSEFVKESFERIQTIFSLKGKTVDESAKAFAFFYNCLVCGIIKSSDLPIDKAQYAFKAIMDKTQRASEYFDVELALKMVDND